VTRPTYLRITLEIFLAICIFYSLYTQIDAGFFAFLVPGLRYILIFILIFSIIFETYTFFKRRKNYKVVQVLMAGFYVSALVTYLTTILLFQDSLLYVREILFFNLYRDRFDQIVSFVEQEPPCTEISEVLCDNHITLPQDIMATTVVWVGKTNGNLFIEFPSRSYAAFLYSPYQTELPVFSAGHYGVTCYYRLSEDWYVCTVGT
jgi:hypothetical protein